MARLTLISRPWKVLDEDRTIRGDGGPLRSARLRRARSADAEPVRARRTRSVRGRSVSGLCQHRRERRTDERDTRRHSDLPARRSVLGRHGAAGPRTSPAASTADSSAGPSRRRCRRELLGHTSSPSSTAMMSPPSPRRRVRRPGTPTSPASDADASAAAVVAAGGTVISPPQDAGPGGRAATCADPTGAEFRLWQARRRLGAQLANAPGSWNFSDLQTADREARTGVLCRRLRLGGGQPARRRHDSGARLR